MRIIACDRCGTGEKIRGAVHTFEVNVTDSPTLPLNATRSLDLCERHANELHRWISEAEERIEALNR